MSETEGKSHRQLSEEFLGLVGMCILQWSTVDDNLFAVFRRCIGPYEQAAVIFYRTPGLDLRFGITDEIVRSVLPKPERRSGAHPHPSVKKWEAAIEGYQKLLAVRRMIAHQPTRPVLEAAAGLKPLPSGHEFYVGEHERMREKEKNTKPLRASDLRAHAGNVRWLAVKIAHFNHEALSERVAEPIRPTLAPT